VQAKEQQNARQKETAAPRGFHCLKRDLKKEENYSESVKIFGTVHK